MPDIRTSVSRNHPYYIDKDRYLELKHFCAQIPLWETKLQIMRDRRNSTYGLSMTTIGKTNDISRPTENRLPTDEELDLDNRVYIFRKALKEVWPDSYGSYLKVIFSNSIIDGTSYDKLLALHPELVQITRVTWYMMYRKFFWLLDKSRK